MVAFRHSPAGPEDITLIHMFYRQWAVIVQIERNPEMVRHVHAAEQALTSDAAQVRDAAIRDADEIVRAVCYAVDGK
jgi:hypothetical protein